MTANPLLLCTAALAVAGAALPHAARADDVCAGEPGGGRVKLTVENIGLRAAQGEVQITVYPDDPRRFLAPHGKVARLRAPAVVPAARSCFWLAPGTYAVAVYHDQNDNHVMDRTALGFPAEGFGFSNDAAARLGPPALEAVRFVLPPQGRTIRIRMRYPKKPG